MREPIVIDRFPLVNGLVALDKAVVIVSCIVADEFIVVDKLADPLVVCSVLVDFPLLPSLHWQ